MGFFRLVEVSARRVLRAARRKYWIEENNAAARRALASRRHIAPLSAANRKRCVDYAREVLGSSEFAPWLQVYTSVSGGFREGWIPDNFYGQVVLPELKGAYSRLAEYKSLAARLLGTPALPDIAYVARGRLFDRDYRAIAVNELPRRGDLVFKADNSLQGRGVKLFRPDDLIEPGEMPDGVLQTYVDQHNELAAFCDVAVATLRLTTVIEPDGTAGLRAGFIRFARQGESHVNSATHVSAAVDIDSGEMSGTAYLPSFLPIDRHPDSGITFAQRLVPGFAECAKLALDLQTKVPFTPCVGWDFAVDRYGAPVLLEWNSGHNGIKISEATAGPCFTGLNWERFGTGSAAR